MVLVPGHPYSASLSYPADALIGHFSLNKFFSYLNQPEVISVAHNSECGLTLTQMSESSETERNF